jgi:hypothetical protein
LLPPRRAASRAFLANQVVEDHPLLISIVMQEAEEHLDNALATMAQECIDPKVIATHHAVMHLLQVQREEIHRLAHHGIINHEEEQQFMTKVIDKKVR